MQEAAGVFRWEIKMVQSGASVADRLLFAYHFIYSFQSRRVSETMTQLREELHYRSSG